MQLGLIALWLVGAGAFLFTIGATLRLIFHRDGDAVERWDIGLVIALGVACLWASPSSVSEFRISPDSLEYVAGARSLVDSGRFVLPGELIPRYPPWFSALWIAPSLVGHTHPGWSVIPVTLSALLALLCAYRLGTGLGGRWGGAMSALLLLMVPGFVFFSRQVLIDIPTTALFLAGALVAARAAANRNYGWGLPLLGGALVGWAILLRPTGGVMALPLAVVFIASGCHQLRSLICLGVPIVGAVLLGAGYNYFTFGDAARSGYNYWCGIPYDFFSLTFGGRFIAQNFRPTFVDSGLGPLIIFALGGWFFLRRSGVGTPSAARIYCRYVVLLGIPLVVFYLLYFFPAVRFIVPVSALVAVLLGGVIGVALERRGAAAGVRRGGAILALILVVGFRVIVPELPPVKGEAARRIAAHTPSGAIVVSGIDPVYLGFMVGMAREYLPISRRVEYASKMITERRLELDPAGIEPRCDNPDPRVLAHGGRWVVPRVALGDLEYVAAALNGGRPVFLEATRIRDGELAEFKGRFVLIERAPRLYEVRLRAAASEISPSHAARDDT
ncbi:MAG: hypothetical protein RL417_1071 [Pseudomonadota bacterium]